MMIIPNRSKASKKSGSPIYLFLPLFKVAKTINYNVTNKNQDIQHNQAYYNTDYY